MRGGRERSTHLHSRLRDYVQLQTHTHHRRHDTGNPRLCVRNHAYFCPCAARLNKKKGKLRADTECNFITIKNNKNKWRVEVCVMLMVSLIYWMSHFDVDGYDMKQETVK